MSNTKKTKKVTMATIKSFIRKNFENLHISYISHFDGMTDGISMSSDRSFMAIKPTDQNTHRTLGITGAWFVGSSRDYFEVYEDDDFKGYEIYNSCGSFVLAVKK